MIELKYNKYLLIFPMNHKRKMFSTEIIFLKNNFTENIFHYAKTNKPNKFSFLHLQQCPQMAASVLCEASLRLFKRISFSSTNILFYFVSLAAPILLVSAKRKT
jgi:hypothetical protein